MCVCPQYRIAASRPRKLKFCCVVWHDIVTVLKTVRCMRFAVVVIDKISCMYCSHMCTFVCLQIARASPLRPIGDVTEAETHQAADVEVMEVYQCEWEHKGVLKEWATDMFDKVTRWGLCLSYNTTTRSEGHVPFLPWQPSSNSRLVRIKQGEVCFLWQ